MSLLDKKIEEYISSNDEKTDIVFEYEDIFEYDFPYEESVPESYYYSQVVDVREYCDRYKNNYYIVYYRIFQAIMIERWQGGYISEIPYYHICQKYEKHSIPYNKFCASMRKATGLTKFNKDQIIGQTEIIHLTYATDGCIGTIKERKPTEVNPSWFDENF